MVGNVRRKCRITVKGKHFYLTEDFTPVSDAIKNIEKELMKGR